MSDYDLIVVGGGPAGMMAAGRAAERGRRVLLLERGSTLGRKLLMTATGRCNVTNTAPLPQFLKAFGRRGDFLRHAFTRFGNAQLLDWLHGRGVETMEERKGRVFPASQDARTILETLLRYLEEGRVELQTGTRVESLYVKHGVLMGVVAGGKEFHSAGVLVATGGLSYPATGSSGDGYALAKQAGHTIVAPFPAIVALQTQEDWPRNLQGTPIKNVSIVVRQRTRKIATTFGEALWTHYGVSGPAILDISREAVLALREGGAASLQMDLRPNDTEEQLDEKLLFAIKKDGKRQVGTVLAEWVVARTATQLAELAEVDPRKKMNQCSKSDRKRLVRLVKHLELHVTGHRPIEEAIVTGGGVSLAEVDSSRMESKILPCLHFAGEVMDLDAPSGGYNLQEAFSTGFMVGESA